jgi:lipoate-protein ligase A
MERVKKDRKQIFKLMYCLNPESTDPYFNLAIEEVLLKNSREEYLIMGINNTSVIIGKHQAAHKETNTKFVLENKIPVIRRISGGGTVFHDKGNLNFTLIRQSETGKQVDFPKYTRPLIDFLLSLGISAKFEGKNDIKVEGLKISGNAEHVYRSRVLHHGTLLFDTSLENLKNSLRKNTSCYRTRAVDSNPSSVTNLRKMMPDIPDIYQFRSVMIDYFLRYFPDIRIHEISSREKEEAEILAVQKYKTWEWNYAYGPEYHFDNRFKIEGKDHSCHLFVKEGIITECKIEGSEKMTDAGKKLIGCRHMVDDLFEVLTREGIAVNTNDILNFF